MGPQGADKTPSEKLFFKWMLQEINSLYLGCSVLCLIDISYLSRFWTQFEAWLAMQEATKDGLRAAPEKTRRCTLTCIHNASAGAEDRKLEAMWSHRTPAEAFQVLKAPDLTVKSRRQDRAVGENWRS